MRVFFLQLILWFAVLPFLVTGAEFSYWTSPLAISEMVPIRIEQTPISSAPLLTEPKIIEQRIISTRVISPLPVTGEVRSEQNLTQLEPLRREKNEKTPTLMNFDDAKTAKPSEVSPVSLAIETELIEEKAKPFPEIKLPSNETPNQTLVLKPPYEECSLPKPMLTTEPKQSLPKPETLPTILGQSPTIAGAVEEVLKELPPYPQGTVDPSMIDPKLTENPEANKELLPEAGQLGVTTTTTKPEETGTKRESWADGALLLATIVSILMLVYAVVMVFDYRQRWMQSLLVQNNRFGSFDDDMELGYSNDAELYGGTLQYGAGSDALGIRRFSPEVFESPVRY